MCVQLSKEEANARKLWDADSDDEDKEPDEAAGINTPPGFDEEELRAQLERQELVFRYVC